MPTAKHVRTEENRGDESVGGDSGHESAVDDGNVGDIADEDGSVGVTTTAEVDRPRTEIPMAASASEIRSPSTSK